MTSRVPGLLWVVVTRVHSPPGRVNSAELSLVVFNKLSSLRVHQVDHFGFHKRGHLVKLACLKKQREEGRCYSYVMKVGQGEVYAQVKK